MSVSVERPNLGVTLRPRTAPEIFEKASWLSEFGREKWRLRGPAYRFAKRASDIFLVLVTMPIWVTTLGLCVLALKIASPRDPVFFVQTRTGKGGRLFRMYKLRTMVTNAEELKEKLRQQSELKWPDFKISADPRITRLGRFYRKTSLDELPQLFNVLRGDMSLVGPRPTSFSPTTYLLWQTERLDVEPGVTGLWQLYGRTITEFDDRLRIDIAYIERRCLALDLEILMRTFLTLLLRRHGC